MKRPTKAFQAEAKSNLWDCTFSKSTSSNVILLSLKAMFRPVLRFAVAHYRTFIDGLDPVRSAVDSSSPHKQQTSPGSSEHQLTTVTSTSSTFNLHFAIPFFTVLYATVQGVLGFDWPANWTKFPPRIDFKSAAFVPHQIFPQTVWAQSDLVLGASTVNMLLIYANLMYRPAIPGRYLMYVFRQKQSKMPVLIGADHGMR